MPAEVYEVVSQGARYWFLFLMVMVAWRSYRWLAKDRRQRKKRLRLLPDAGFIGEFVVQQGNEELPQGTVLPVPREGILGSLRSCDLCIPMDGIAKNHLSFQYDDEKGFFICPLGKHSAQLDDTVIHRKEGKQHMVHGARLTIGKAVLRLRMFAGFDSITRASYMEQATTPIATASPTVALNSEQLALWQAQQQYWLLAQQALLQTTVPPQNTTINPDSLDNESLDTPLQSSPIEIPSTEDEAAVRDRYTYTALLTQDSLDDHEEDTSKDLHYALKSQQPSFSPFAPLQDESSPSNEITFPQDTVFYAPTQDAQDDLWPYAPFPQSTAEFTNQGYTYPEYVEPSFEDEDLTDAAAPPKSMYIQPDEAEHAKRILWDKYLRGGKKR